VKKAYRKSQGLGAHVVLTLPGMQQWIVYTYIHEKHYSVMEGNFKGNPRESNTFSVG